MTKKFAFPAIYNFPPFWTLQDVMETKRRQCDMWGDLILSYMKSHNQNELDVSKALNTELFSNKSIDRRLDRATAVFFLNQLVERQNAEWKDPGKTIKIIWRKPEEWAAIFKDWVQKNGYQNIVFTFYELREGEGTAGEPFHMMDQDLMKKAIQCLAKDKKAKFMEAAEFDECGVRFI